MKVLDSATLADEGLLCGGGTLLTSEGWASGEVFLPGLLSLHKQHACLLEASASGLAAPVSADDGASTSTIFLLCVFMYGGVGAMWLLYYSASAPVKRDDSGMVYTGMLCVSWASTSIGMIVLNKQLAVALEAPALIAMAQMAVCFATMLALWGRKLLEADRNQLAYWMIIPCFFAGMLCTSIYTVQYISISLFTVIRNLMPLVTLPVESALMPPEKRPRVSWWIVGSLLVTLAGALMYAQGIHGVSALGVLFAVVNMGITVCDRLLQRRLLTQECKDLHVVVCTMVTNFWGMAPCLLLAFVTPQIHELPQHNRSWTDPKVLAMLVGSGLVSIGIGALGFEVQRRLSATSFLIMQNVSKLAVVLIGVVIFGDAIRSPLAAAGMVVSLTGGFLYSRLQMALNAEEKPLLAKSGADSAAAAHAKSSA